MSRIQDSYNIVRKTIEAREVCLASLRKLLAGLREVDVQEGLETIRQETEMRQKVHRHQAQETGNYKNSSQMQQQQTGNSWKSKLEQVFELIEHMRKLTCYVV